jgi:hypothetical protein
MLFSADGKPVACYDGSALRRLGKLPRLAREVSSPPPDPFCEQLAARVFERIDSRLPGRIRNLSVVLTKHAVVLAGQCSTFYSKQLAQHAAMGVLEYEKLINHIEVNPPT